MAKRVKYHRSPHLPWPPGRTGDDVMLDSIQPLEQLNDVVITEKLDGENTTLYPVQIQSCQICKAKPRPNDQALEARRCGFKSIGERLTFDLNLARPIIPGL